jgi:hypothetical protein
MGLREFVDEDGRRWRAWDIVPDQMHPATRHEDYMQGFLDGWLAFETLDGADRARLTPVPIRWEQGSEEELRALLARAERAGPRPRRSSSAARERGEEKEGPAKTEAPGAPAGAPAGGEWSGSWPALPAERGPSAPVGTIRTFRYPGGRFWTAYEHITELPSPGSPGLLRPRVVLRFTSGTRALDLLAWPADWFRHADDELAELLWRAFPRDPKSKPAGPHRRRRADRQTSARE